MNFNDNWSFSLDASDDAYRPGYDDSGWRVLDLPHDWSIEGSFSPDNPAGIGGGALPGGIGWYRKNFTVDKDKDTKRAYIEFGGVYQNSEVWINGHSLGVRPYGYSSFRYDMTPWLHYGDTVNVIAVKADNSKQPNSRWYSGSGIYRNVKLLFTDPVSVDQWGTFVRATEVTTNLARLTVDTRVLNTTSDSEKVVLKTLVYDAGGRKIAETATENVIPDDTVLDFSQNLEVKNPELWSVDDPYLYTLVSEVTYHNRKRDNYSTKFGIRHFDFDPEKGFSLNGKHLKIRGVCNHHDLGPLGTAVNESALARQLDILKEMGCNSIRTSHNPPAPELLDLCDEKGFLVMDEAFDMWAKGKTKYDYHLYWDKWHKKDLSDFIKRDRNHPSVFIWSIGNEILEQWDSTGIPIATELAGIVRDLDTTRPITSACNFPDPSNFIIRSGQLDLVGYNYHQDQFPEFPETFPGQKFIATETTSALATRGHYDMPSDSIRRWPVRWDKPFAFGNPGNTCSSYDNCSTPWGSTHEETLKVIEKYDFLSGMYVWTGFDYLGEPTPYGWPSRSSYFGILDLCGFPKDAFYLYKSEWTGEPVLHLFPHWNWSEGDTVDVWAYTNCDSASLFLNGKPLGTRSKEKGQMHLEWRETWSPGELVCMGYKDGAQVMTDTVRTAGESARIILIPDKDVISNSDNELSFVKVRIEDAHGNLVPHADNLVEFTISGPGAMAAVGNGDQTSHESFMAMQRHAFNGLCLAVIRSDNSKGTIELSATAEGLEPGIAKIRIGK
ncbi:MAG TPA: beta-galactosidase GalB [Bacteroidales bacterium]|nr:beta-galactosidase GalB [Bacteroidales bacterium]